METVKISDPKTGAKEWHLGQHVMDQATGVEGALAAVTLWFDRSNEAAILRIGLDQDGAPYPLHWFPVSRLVDLSEGDAS